MPLIDHWEQTGNRVEPLLQPGERMLAFSSTGFSEGVAPTPPEETGEKERPSHGQRVLGRVVDFLTGNVGPSPELAVRILIGRAAGGAWDSLGSQAHQAISGNGPAVYLGVTDRRVLVFEDDSELRSERPLPLLWAVERSQVAGAEVRWTRLSLARLRMSFRDESWIEFASLLGMGRRRAARLRDALLTPSWSGG